MDDLHDFIPIDPSAKPQSWLKQNWLAFAMFIAWAAGQMLGAGGWVQTRDSRENNLSAEVEDLRMQLIDVRAKYVRQDVFDQVLRRIDDRLASIDSKIK